MIRIGLSKSQKEKLIKNYIKQNKISKVFVLYAKENDQALEFGKKYEKIEYNEWEMYRTFYPMISKVDGETLLIVNDALRTTVYQDLKVNCATIWLNQTPHRIIFNELPFIDSVQDFRILQKLDQGSKQVDKFDYSQLEEQDIKVVPREVEINIINIKTTEKQKQSYETKKEKIIKEIEESVNKDPNNVPRRLQLLAGDYKKSIIEFDKYYLARNRRFKEDNVYTYRDYEPRHEYTILDLPITRRELIDYLMVTQNYSMTYVSTDLAIDEYLIGELEAWKERLDEFYGKASLYK